MKGQVEREVPAIIRTVVFSDGPGGGNPAPVFLYADSMTDRDMQEAAARLGEEAVFVLSPRRDDCAVRMRYFVPDHELSICAHDTIGAVTVLVEEGLLAGEGLPAGEGMLAGKGLLAGEEAVIETEAGPVRVSWSVDGKGILVRVAQFEPVFGTITPDNTALAEALGIGINQLAVSSDMPAECVSTSRPKLMVPVRDRETLDSLQPDFEKLWNLCDDCGCSGFYVYTRDPKKTDVCYARQFPCRSGYLEDPATGIAASALGAYWIRHQLMPVEEGRNCLHVYQGQAMGRPSYLEAEMLVRGGEIKEVSVCGYAQREEKK